jgi:hypothetical protein
MSDDPDLAKLARDFMDLWQEQVAAAATDPALAKWAETWMAQMTAAMAAPRHDGTGATAGAAASGTASVDILQRLDEFAGRLDVCEKRLAAMERKAQRKGGPDSDRDRGRRR